jgi:lambda family phage portal protein
MPSLISRVWSAIKGSSRPELPPEIRAKLAQKLYEIRAKYDAAQTTDENRKHFLNADSLSARTANSHEVRRILRNRSRYERANNSYLCGMAKTFANEIIGTGPRLQVQTGNEKVNRAVEQRLSDWLRAADIRSKLVLNLEARVVDGELFNLFTTNGRLLDPVKLDLKPLEADQVTTPLARYGDPTAVDGIRFDRAGNPREYDILPYHPGGEGEFWLNSYPLEPNVVAAENVLHFFRRERAGQARGVPDITPALPLFAQMRRYTLAVLAAAELAASFAAIIKTDLPPGIDPGEAVAWETVDIVRGMMQTLPAGADMQQFRAEQPVTSFAEFIRCLLREICRCLEMPFSIATGDGSDNSYSGGRLDVQAWERKVKIERCAIELQLLNPIFDRWLQEASLISGYLPTDDVGPANLWRKSWMWDGFKHVDPSKEATANDTGLKNGTYTLEELIAERGKDWSAHEDQLRRQAEFFKEIGLPNPLGGGGGAQPAPEEQQQQDSESQPQEVGDAVAA